MGTAQLMPMANAAAFSKQMKIPCTPPCCNIFFLLSGFHTNLFSISPFEMQFNVPPSLLVLITYSWIRKKLSKTKAAAASAR